MLRSPFVEPGQQKKRRPQSHEQKLQRGRVFLDIEKQDRSLFQRRLNVPVTLRYASLSDRRISVNVGQAKQDKCQRKNQTETNNQLPATLRIQKVDAAKRVASAHHRDPGDDLEKNKLWSVERQEYEAAN